MSRKIGNIGVLDIRSATDESVAEIERIGNVGTVLFSAKTAHLLARLNISNMGSSAEVPDDYKLITGQLEITRDYLGSVTEPAGIMITGQLFVMPDVAVADFERCFKGFVITGQVFAPRALMPVVQSKIRMLTGQSIPYLDGARVIHGGLTIDNAFLNSLKPDTALVVIGKLRMAGEIDTALFDAKIAVVQVIGKAFLREEYAELLHRKMGESGQVKTEYIPKGFTYFESELVLDAMTLKALKAPKIYTPEFIHFLDDVTPDVLAELVEALRPKSFVICRTELRAAVLDRLADPSTSVLTYSDRLMMIDGDYELSDAELEFLEGKMTYIVNGELTIDGDVTPERILEKVEWVDNFGGIIGDTRQLGALKNRLRTNSGELTDRSKAGPADDSESNVGVLKL